MPIRTVIEKWNEYSLSQGMRSFGKVEAVHAVGMHGFEDLRQELRELEL